MAEPSSLKAVPGGQRHEVIAGLVQDPLVILDRLSPFLFGHKLVRRQQTPGGALRFTRDADA